MLPIVLPHFPHERSVGVVEGESFVSVKPSKALGDDEVLMFPGEFWRRNDLRDAKSLCDGLRFVPTNDDALAILLGSDTCRWNYTQRARDVRSKCVLIVKTVGGLADATDIMYGHF